MKSHRQHMLVVTRGRDECREGQVRKIAREPVSGSVVEAAMVLVVADGRVSERQSMG